MRRALRSGGESFSPDSDAASVRRLFALIARAYDPLNSILSFGLDAGWRKKLADSLYPMPSGRDGRILDIAAGTLEVSMVLAERFPEHEIAALDFCLPMLLRGKKKAMKQRGDKIRLLSGDARALPLRDACVDAVTVAFGLRNIRPRERAYAEALRVLRPGGRFRVLEFVNTEKPVLFGLYNFYLDRVLPTAGSFFSGNKAAYRYLADTISRYPAAEKLDEEMCSAGFAGVRHEIFTAGIVGIHSGEKAA
ncbi:MAG: ubiquinone/menaquinone biosynthesis methyltransferase [Desulfovibrio sp.]|jgi:demethylmenaquinone methyltransferase/2-methoxy-6-polyprenyl-1,4-benzoquinol methylase|nr:ubiquinone/menaquinone biosynthesis methyltransferase [Desulfovibrio sp.]